MKQKKEKKIWKDSFSLQIFRSRTALGLYTTVTAADVYLLL